MPATTVKTLFITTTGASTFTIPSDFVSLISVECIGGGGTGGIQGGNLSNGGGGGAYAKSTSVTGLIPGGTAFVNVGLGGIQTSFVIANGVAGGDTWFNSVSNAAPTLTSQGALAKGGGAGTSGGVAGVGGSSATSVGDVKFSGGSGGTSAIAPLKGAGGGAGGPGGVGGQGGSAGGSGSGGGGSGATLTAAGTAGGNGLAGAGGTGGASAGQTGGTGATPSVAAGVALVGGGGGGGANTTNTLASAGGAGNIWTSSYGIKAGPGGGVGGSGANSLAAPSGGLYGGGGTGQNTGSGGSGAQGIIVLTYLAGYTFNSNDEPFERIFMTSSEFVDQFVGSSLWNWGGPFGTLGDGTTSSRSSPVTTAGGGTNWKEVACGRQHTAAIKTDGTLWVWGSNGSGALGDNTATARSSPVTTVGGGTNWKQVSGGTTYTAAIKTDGTLWTWGNNGNGRLGDGTTLDRSSPVTTAGGGVNWKQVSCGDAHTAAIKTDGTLWTWGKNDDGRCGDGTITDRSSPVTTAGGGTDWKQVAGGGKITIAIKIDGTLWTCGYNLNGNLGDGTTTSRRSPVTTAGGGTNWKQAAGGRHHTVAVKTDGTLWTWGFNNAGQLGTGTTTTRSSPGTTAGGGTNWKQAAAPSDSDHTAAIKTDGALWIWGKGGSGALGDGTVTNKSSPIQPINNLSNWKEVSCGYNVTAAVAQN